MGIMPQGWYPYGISYLHRKESMYVKNCIHRNYTTLYNRCQGLLSLAPRKWGCNPPMATLFILLLLYLITPTSFWNFYFLVVILFFYMASSKIIIASKKSFTTHKSFTITIIRVTSCLIASIIGIEFALYKTKSHLQALYFLKRGATLSQLQNTWS